MTDFPLISVKTLISIKFNVGLAQYIAHRLCLNPIKRTANSSNCLLYIFYVTWEYIFLILHFLIRDNFWFFGNICLRDWLNKGMHLYYALLSHLVTIIFFLISMRSNTHTIRDFLYFLVNLIGEFFIVSFDIIRVKDSLLNLREPVRVVRWLAEPLNCSNLKSLWVFSEDH